MDKLVIMASGSGSNFEAIAKAVNKGEIKANIELLIVNNKDAKAIERAKKLNVNYTYNNCNDIDEIISIIKDINPTLILLAGYMKVLPQKFVTEFNKKIINIHPSLLPKYKGLNAVEQALANNEEEIGVTIHYVDEHVDTGEIIAQKSFCIKNLSEEEVYEKLHKEEHELYVKSIVKLLEGLNEKSTH